MHFHVEPRLAGFDHLALHWPELPEEFGSELGHALAHDLLAREAEIGWGEPVGLQIAKLFVFDIEDAGRSFKEGFENRVTAADFFFGAFESGNVQVDARPADDLPALVAYGHAARQNGMPLSIHAAEPVLDLHCPWVRTHSFQAAMVRSASSGCSTAPQPKSEHCSWVHPDESEKDSLV